MNLGYGPATRPAAGLGGLIALLVLVSGRPASAEPAMPPPPARTAPASRTLGDIHIEGEIAVPQVLFITARDQRRFMEFQHRRYLRTSLEIGEQTVLPSRIAVIRSLPADARKETQR